MRYLVTLFVALLPAMSADADETRKYVDLDRPGAFEALRESNPGHYVEVAKVIQAASESACEWRSRSLAVKADPLDTSCGSALFMTSFPPKRRVTFQLGDTSYAKTVALENWDGMMKPALHSGN